MVEYMGVVILFKVSVFLSSLCQALGLGVPLTRDLAYRTASVLYPWRGHKDICTYPWNMPHDIATDMAMMSCGICLRIRPIPYVNFPEI